MYDPKDKDKEKQPKQPNEETPVADQTTVADQTEQNESENADKENDEEE